MELGVFGLFKVDVLLVFDFVLCEYGWYFFYVAVFSDNVDRIFLTQAPHRYLGLGNGMH